MYFVTNGNDISTVEGFLSEEFLNFHIMLNYIKYKNYKAFINCIYNLKYARWKPSFLKDNPDLKEIIKSLRDTYKDFIKKEIVEKFFNKSIKEIIEEIKIVYPIINTLCNLIIEFDSYFMNVKKEKNIYTFSDISHFCLNLFIENNEINSYVLFDTEDDYNEGNEYTSGIRPIVEIDLSKVNVGLTGDGSSDSPYSITAK